jgi:hypothetical protein
MFKQPVEGHWEVNWQALHDHHQRRGWSGALTTEKRKWHRQQAKIIKAKHLGGGKRGWHWEKHCELARAMWHKGEGDDSGH